MEKQARLRDTTPQGVFDTTPERFVNKPSKRSLSAYYQGGSIRRNLCMPRWRDYQSILLQKMPRTVAKENVNAVR